MTDGRNAKGKVAEPQRHVELTFTFSLPPFFSSPTHALTSRPPWLPRPTDYSHRTRLVLSPVYSVHLILRFPRRSRIMAGRGGGAARKTLLAPIHFIFKLLQQRATVSVWLYEQLAFRIEGKIRVRMLRWCRNARTAH